MKRALLAARLNRNLRHSLKLNRMAGFELMEDRRMMAAGNILFDNTTGKITIEGSNSHADTVNITIDNRNTLTTSDDVVRIELKNTGTPLIQEFRLKPYTLTASPSATFYKAGTATVPTIFDYPGVNEIIFNGNGGNDFINNKSAVKLRANGGYGNDVILGGSAADVILAGEGNDFVDGRLGDDMIWGEGGMDSLFGDSGIDMILGGAGSDCIHGGGHADFLYGEAGNDWIFGGGGLDDITDNSGTNTIKIDYGVSGVLVNGFETFDWFDRNLDDASVRSLARLLYRDMSLQRNDMLEIYSAITTNNYVSTNEFNDLKDLISTKLTMWDSVRNLAKKVVNGDRATQWSQGGSLGNSTAGVNGQHLTNLVDKWFKGGDLPTIAGVADVWYVNMSGSLFRNGINFNDVDQGRDAKDCYFLAVLAETAQHQPADILNMFYDNGDGTFTVRFFRGSSSEYVTVNRMLPIDSDATAHFAGWGGGLFHDSANELWVALAEKAYMQINESGWINQDNNNSYTGIQNGHIRHAFAHVTGHSGSDYSLSESGIINAQNAGKAIVLASKETVVNSDISDNHAYSLVSYDATTKKFRLFNPHNTTSSKPAFLELTWNEIKQNFSYSTSAVL